MWTGSGGDQLRLRARVVENVGSHRTPFRFVRVEQDVRCPAVDLGGELPAEVEGILHTEIETLTAHRWVDVCGIAGEEHPAAPVVLR